MASRSLGSLTVDLLLKTGGFQAGMDRSARDAEKTLKRIQTTARGVGSAIAVGFAALGASNLFGAIIANTTEAEDALKQLDARIRSTGGVANVTAEQLTTFAQSMSEVTTFSDDAIVSMQSLLLTFTNIRGDQINGATEAILDFASALGTDLPSAAQTVGRALNDPVRGITQLRRSGIQFSEEQERLIKSLVRTGDMASAQGIILDKLAVQYGGAARAAADTLGGSLKQLQNAFGDLLEVSDGTGEAADAVKEFTALLRDPATVQAAQTLTTGIITAFASVTEAIVNTVGAVKFLGESFSALRFGAAADDLVRLNDQLEQAQKLRDAGPASLATSGAFLDRLRFFGKDGFVEWYSDEELDREISDLKGKIEQATKDFRPPIAAPTTAPSGATGGAAFTAPDSEEFLKVSNQLREQIALYGQVGEAAKIRYQIESGGLDDLTSAEQQRVLSLAQQYDSVVAAAAAVKELEQANKQLQQAYDSQLDSYRQQIALTGDVTELQRLRFEIESGGLQGVNAQQQQYLETQALILDSEKMLTEAIKANEEARGEALALLDELATPQEKYASQITKLNELLNEGALSQDEYGRAVANAQTKLIEATDTWSEFRKEAARNTQDIIADTLVNGFDDGARGVLDSFANMLKQMAAQAIAADLGAKLFGTEGSGDSGWVGALANWAAGAFAGGFATGGTMNPGQWGIVGENGPEIAYAGTAPLNIQPMSKGAATNNFNISIAAPNEQVGRVTAQQAATAVARQLAMAQRRNG